MEKIIIANSYDKKQEIINYLGDKIIYKNNNSRIILADLEINQEEYLIKNELAKINMKHGEELIYFQKPTSLEDEGEIEKINILENKNIKINSPFKVTDWEEIIKPIISGDDLEILSLSDSDSDSDTVVVKNNDLLASIYLEYKGKNVDVFICDDSPPPMNHPEFLSNDDNSGKSRFHAIDWYNSKYKPLNENVPFINGPPGISLGRLSYYDQRIRMYAFSPRTPSYHGGHVAGIACGNTSGWARESNIYFSDFQDYYYIIPPAVPGQLQSYTPVAWNAGEVILNFHKNKPINPHTGRKNPTIVNMSFGFFINPQLMNNIKKIFYRGQMHERPEGGWIAHDVRQFGIIIYTQPNTGEFRVYGHGYAGNEQDMPIMVPYIEDMIEEGIVVIVAAGNNSYKMDVPGGLDYDNYYTLDQFGDDFKIYYHRGSVPATIPGTIVVGSMSPSYPEYKSWFSTTGPGIDIWAPGHGVQSAWVEHGISDCPCQATATFCSFNITKDNRDEDYRMAKISGTSMAAPQITGMLACYAEKEPDITPQSAKDWLVANGKPVLNDIGPVPDSTVVPGSYRDFNSLQGATNKVAYFPYGSYTIMPNVISPTPTPTPTGILIPVDPGGNSAGPSIPPAPILPSPTTPPTTPPPPGTDD